MSLGSARRAGISDERNRSRVTSMYRNRSVNDRIFDKRMTAAYLASHDVAGAKEKGQGFDPLTLTRLVGLAQGATAPDLSILHQLSPVAKSLPATPLSVLFSTSTDWFELRAEKLTTGLTRKRTGKCAVPDIYAPRPSSVVQGDGNDFFHQPRFRGDEEKRCPGVFKRKEQCQSR